MSHFNSPQFKIEKKISQNNIHLLKDLLDNIRIFDCKQSVLLEFLLKSSFDIGKDFYQKTVLIAPRNEC